MQFRNSASRPFSCGSCVWDFEDLASAQEVPAEPENGVRTGAEAEGIWADLGEMLQVVPVVSPEW